MITKKNKCITCNDKYFIISNDKNWNNEIQKCDDCNYLKTDEEAKKYKTESEQDLENALDYKINKWGLK